MNLTRQNIVNNLIEQAISAGWLDRNLSIKTGYYVDPIIAQILLTIDYRELEEATRAYRKTHPQD